MENIKKLNKNFDKYNFILKCKDKFKYSNGKENKVLFKCAFIIAILIFFIKININKKFILYYHSKLSENLAKKNEINKQFIKNLKSLFKEDEIIENAMMSKYTTFKIGGPATYLVKPKSISQIIELIKLCNNNKINYFILGNGSIYIFNI